MNDVGYLFGVWLGGFVFPMIAGYAFLLPAGSPKRKPGTATVLRCFAVCAAALLAYASYAGAGGRVNFGAVLAVVVVMFIAARQARSAA